MQGEHAPRRVAESSGGDAHPHRTDGARPRRRGRAASARRSRRRRGGRAGSRSHASAPGAAPASAAATAPRSRRRSRARRARAARTAAAISASTPTGFRSTWTPIAVVAQVGERVVERGSARPRRLRDGRATRPSPTSNSTRSAPASTAASSAASVFSGATRRRSAMADHERPSGRMAQNHLRRLDFRPWQNPHASFRSTRRRQTLPRPRGDRARLPPRACAPSRAGRAPAVRAELERPLLGHARRTRAAHDRDRRSTAFHEIQTSFGIFQ